MVLHIIFSVSWFWVSALGKLVPFAAVTFVSNYVPLSPVLHGGTDDRKLGYKSQLIFESSLEYIELFLST